MQIWTSQLEKVTNNSTSGTKSATKMPMFDIDKDQDSFKVWLSRWKLHVQGHSFHKIPDKEEQQTRVMMEHTSCLSDNTLNWLINKNFAEEDLDNPEFVIKAIEEKVQRTSNPLVHQVELYQITQHKNETADSLIQRIQEKSNKCDFKAVKNFQDHQNMITLLIAVGPEVR